MTDTHDNLTDEQRERLGRMLLPRLERMDVRGCDWDGNPPWRAKMLCDAASALYLAGRDDERAKWRERVEETERQWAAQVILDKGHAIDWKLARRALCEAFPDCFDATGGEHG